MTPSERAYKLMLTEYPDLLGAEDAAKILGVSRQYIYQMIGDGSLYGIKIGKAYKISKIRLIEYLIGESKTA
jgi:excisionase family DNA binding protein